jgi:hypothetical protein
VQDFQNTKSAPESRKLSSGGQKSKNYRSLEEICGIPKILICHMFGHRGSSGDARLGRHFWFFTKDFECRICRF